MSIGIMYHSFTVFFLPLKRDLAVSTAAISLLYGATRLEGGAEGPIVGRLIDKFGPRVVIIGGLSMASLGLILLAQTHSFVTFFLVYVFIVSFGYNAGSFHPVSTAVNSWFIRRRATAFAIIAASGSVGGMIMAPLLSRLILNYGWRTGAFVSGVLILAIAVPAATLIQRTPESRGLHPDGRPLPPPSTQQSSFAVQAAADVHFTLKQALRTFTYWLLTMSITLRLLVTVALAAHLIPILTWKGMDEAKAAYLVSLFAFGTIIFTLSFGWMGDRWNKPWLCALGILATVVSLLVLIVSQSIVALYLFPIGLAFTMGTTPLNWALIGDMFGRRSYATLRGIMGVVYGTATFGSPIYAGWIFDRTDSYNIALITFAVILLTAASLFTILHRPTPPPAPQPLAPDA
ncbi:MAG: MFS transporter [Dehalococcoidia bacterium]|nr:MFS transporter [Dehalococcoidia bacterium]